MNFSIIFTEIRFSPETTKLIIISGNCYLDQQERNIIEIAFLLIWVGEGKQFYFCCLKGQNKGWRIRKP